MASREEKIQQILALQAQGNIPTGDQPLSREEKIQKIASLQQAKNSEPSLASKLFDYAMRGLDYAGGLTRTAIASHPYTKLAAMAGGGQGGSLMQDVPKALQGQAPTSAEFLERAGVPAGASLSDVVPGMYSETGEGLPLQKGGMFDPTARGAAGFALDIATDPLTYTGVNIIKPAGKTIAKGLEKIGNAATRSGVKNIDRALVEKGKRPLSDILIKENIAGSPVQIEKSLEDLSQKAARQRGALYKEASEKGATVKTNDIAQRFERYLQTVEKKSSTQANKDLVETLREWGRNNIPSAPEISIQEASNIKSGLRAKLPSNFYNMDNQVIKPADEAMDKLAGLYQRKIVSEADKVSPGVGKKINEVNKDWGTLIESDSPLSREARADIRRNGITTMDVMYSGGLGVTTESPGKSLAALGIKKLADISKTIGARTRAGKALRGAARATERGSAWVGPALQRYLVNQSKQPASVDDWQSIGAVD